MRLAVFAITTCVAFLVGCTSAPPLNFAVPNVSSSTQRLDADLRAVSVSFAAPNEQTGEIPSNGEGIPQLWERAVVEALNKTSVFDDDSARKVNLFIKIQELDPPAGGFTMVTATTAKYLLVNRKTGETLMEETISTKGIVPPGYAFVGVVRAKESINRAVQNNILDFLQRLEARKVLTSKRQ